MKSNIEYGAVDILSEVLSMLKSFGLASNILLSIFHDSMISSCYLEELLINYLLTVRENTHGIAFCIAGASNHKGN